MARQRAIHAERDIVLPILSECPSVCPSNFFISNNVIVLIVYRRVRVKHYFMQ